MSSEAAPTRWTSIQSAADVLGMTSAALRKMLERNARRAEDGVTEALVSGVRARKLGRHWRVTLSAAWSESRLVASRGSGRSPVSSQTVRSDREGARS
jgi:hypothetical protein